MKLVGPNGHVTILKDKYGMKWRLDVLNMRTGRYEQVLTDEDFARALANALRDIGITDLNSFDLLALATYIQEHYSEDLDVDYFVGQIMTKLKYGLMEVI